MKVKSTFDWLISKNILYLLKGFFEILFSKVIIGIGLKSGNASSALASLKVAHQEIKLKRVFSCFLCANLEVKTIIFEL